MTYPRDMAYMSSAPPGSGRYPPHNSGANCYPRGNRNLVGRCLHSLWTTSRTFYTSVKSTLQRQVPSQFHNIHSKNLFNIMHPLHTASHCIFFINACKLLTRCMWIIYFIWGHVYDQSINQFIFYKNSILRQNHIQCSY